MFFRSIKERTELPDMIIVDGGIPQIRAAREIVDQLHLDVKIFGLVKNDKHQTASLMDDEFNNVMIDRESPLFF
ncbi:MAG: excinuclease ABC subunit C, partial [Erysipelotrichaceae bacterium]|nr:excinuclease ABC subunit C [Erysipelotrichaceae bacterium]